MQFLDAESGFFGKLADRRPGVAPVMAEIFVDGSVERWEGGNQQNDGAVRRDDRSNGFQCGCVLFHMFQNVDDDGRIRLEARERAEFRRKYIASEGVKIGLMRKSLRETFDAFGFDVNSDHGFAREQFRSEVSDAASDFENSRAQLPLNQSVLPGEVILRKAHPQLVFHGVASAVHCDHFKHNE